MSQPISVLPQWISHLKMQQQSVLLLALRGPDGAPKHTKFKVLLRAYRGTVLKAAKYGRALYSDEVGDSFMSLDVFYDLAAWESALDAYLEDEADASILHHYTHFMHACQILAYKHPRMPFKIRWSMAYTKFAERLHLPVESEEEMDRRLSDWNQEHWGP